MVFLTAVAVFVLHVTMEDNSLHIFRFKFLIHFSHATACNSFRNRCFKWRLGYYNYPSAGIRQYVTVDIILLGSSLMYYFLRVGNDTDVCQRVDIYVFEYNCE
jgi:hypothetical protein